MKKSAIISALVFHILMVTAAANAQDSFEAAKLSSDNVSAPEETDLSSARTSEIRLGIGSYKYVELSLMDLTGPSFNIQATETFKLAKDSPWFGSLDVQGMYSPDYYHGGTFDFAVAKVAGTNDWELQYLNPRPYNSPDRDPSTYMDLRATMGRDFIDPKTAFAPYIGLGIRYLRHNGDFRRQTYYYVPIGVNIKTKSFTKRPVTFNFEYDQLIRGNQTTDHSPNVPWEYDATTTAPAFSIQNAKSEHSFTQKKGWGARASVTYPVSKKLSLTPYFTHWNIDDSNVVVTSFTLKVYTDPVYTREVPTGWREPKNKTNEFGLKIGYRF